MSTIRVERREICIISLRRHSPHTNQRSPLLRHQGRIWQLPENR